MELSKYLKPAGYVVAGLAALEIYHHFFARKRKPEVVEEVNEIFFIRQPVDKNTPLTRQMRLGSERYDHHADVLENLILSAQRTLHVMMYLCSSRKLSEALIEAHRRGVKVFLVFDASMEHGAKNSQVHALHLAGVAVKKFHSTDHVTMHHKMCLIDVPYDDRQDKLIEKQNSPPQRFTARVKLPQRNGVLIGGSLNWTGSGLTNNFESYYVTSDPNFCEKAGREFFNIWNESIKIV